MKDPVDTKVGGTQKCSTTIWRDICLACPMVTKSWMVMNVWHPKFLSYSTILIPQHRLRFLCALDMSLRLSPSADDSAYRLQPKDLHRRGYPGNSDDHSFDGLNKKNSTFFNFKTHEFHFKVTASCKNHTFFQNPPLLPSLLQRHTHTQCFEFNHLFQLEVHHFCMGHILKSWGCHPPKSSSFPY